MDNLTKPAKFTLEVELPESTTAADIAQILSDVSTRLTEHYDDQKDMGEWNGLTGGLFLHEQRVGGWRIAGARKWDAVNGWVNA